MSKIEIIDIINNNHVFGFGQISHDPRGYFDSCNGNIIGNIISWENPDAVIITKMYNLEIKKCGGFVMRIIDRTGLISLVQKVLSNTASPECCVAAAEEQLRIYASMGTYQTTLECRRRSAQLSRAELSKLSGVHEQLIAKYETKERDISTARYNTVCKLADALQCNTSDIAWYD